MPRIVTVQGADQAKVSEASVLPVNLIRIYEASDKEVIEEIIKVFGSEANKAIIVARCESRFRTGVISPTNDAGVFQINLSAHYEQIPGETRQEKIIWLQDYKNNIGFAYQIYLKSGWKPWYMSERCHNR